MVTTSVLTDGSKSRSAKMRQAQEGNAPAYASLLEEITPMLRVYFNKRLGASHDAEDFVQQVLLRIHLYRANFSGTDSFDPWMYTVARNVLWDLLGQHGKHRQDDKSFLDECAIEAYKPVQEISLALESAMGNLSAESQRAVVLTKIEGLDIEEAAALEKVSASAMKVRIHRALKVLRENLWME